jgi:hypothetical protein
MRKNQILSQHFKSTFKVGDVVEAHSTDKLYYISAIGKKRWLGIDSRGVESVRTIIGTCDWRMPEHKRRDDFIAYLKKDILPHLS